MYKKIIVIILVHGLLGIYLNKPAIGEPLVKEIRVQIKPIYKKVENKSYDNNIHYEPRHIKYQDVENTDIAKKLVSIKQFDTNKFINSANDSLCQKIKDNLASKLIIISDDQSDIIIEVAIEKTAVSHFGQDLVLEAVSYTGLANGKNVFFGKFIQNYKFPSFGSTKSPQQIGAILAKKIAKEIKKLNR